MVLSDACLRRRSLTQPIQRRWQSISAHPSSQLVTSSWQLLWTHLWPMVALFALSDGIILLLQRVSQRLTNEGKQSTQCNVRLLCTCVMPGSR